LYRGGGGEGRGAGAAWGPGHAAARWWMGGGRRSSRAARRRWWSLGVRWVAQPSEAPGPQAAPAPLPDEPDRPAGVGERTEGTSKLAALASRPASRDGRRGVSAGAPGRGASRAALVGRAAVPGRPGARGTRRLGGGWGVAAALRGPRATDGGRSGSAGLRSPRRHPGPRPPRHRYRWSPPGSLGRAGGPRSSLRSLLGLRRGGPTGRMDSGWIVGTRGQAPASGGRGGGGIVGGS
jgi:hypothetical protein